MTVRKPYHAPRLVQLAHLCGVFLCVNEATFTFLLWDGKRGKLCAACEKEIRTLITNTHGEAAIEQLEIEALAPRVVQ